MPDDTTDMPREGDQAQGSPRMKRTRRRKLLSCYDCRRRKLHCDRAVPACGRCTKAGQASDCLYIESISDLPSVSRSDEKSARKPTKRHNETPTAASQGGDAYTRLANQECRIRELENALANQTRKSSDSLQPPAICDQPDTPVSLSEVIPRATVRGESFQTQSHGRTCAASVLDDPELRRFNSEIYDHFSAIATMRRELRDEETVTSNLNSSRIILDADLRALLPPKPETDELVHLYLDHYGKMFHVLFMPTFWEAYSEMWRKVVFADVHFVAIVLAMIASVSCLRPLTTSALEARLKADTIIDSIDSWLDHRESKRSILSDLQLRVLLAVAKQASGRKFKRTWIELGRLLQLCMEHGLHRERAWLGSEHQTPIESELRRRVWAAAMELELQAAFDRGMVSAIPPMDALPPTNIHDRDLATIPVLNDSNAPIVMDGFTRMTGLATSFRSISIRLEVLSRLNGQSKHRITFDDTKRYTESLQDHLQAVLDLFESHDPTQIPESMRILQLNLRQYILVLNSSFIQGARTKSEKDFSRMVCLQQAVEIKHLHDSLARPTCLLALELFRADQVRATLAVCQVASQICKGPDQDFALSSWANSIAAEMVPLIKDRLKQKVMSIGREQRHLWCVLVMEAYRKAKRDPGQRMIYMQEAVDSMSEVYRGMLAMRSEVFGDGQMLDMPLEWNFDDGIGALAGPLFPWDLGSS